MGHVGDILRDTGACPLWKPVVVGFRALWDTWDTEVEIRRAHDACRSR